MPNVGARMFLKGLHGIYHQVSCEIWRHFGIMASIACHGLGSSVVSKVGDTRVPRDLFDSCMCEGTEQGDMGYDTRKWKTPRTLR